MDIFIVYGKFYPPNIICCSMIQIFKFLEFKFYINLAGVSEELFFRGLIGAYFKKDKLYHHNFPPLYTYHQLKLPPKRYNYLYHSAISVWNYFY